MTEKQKKFSEITTIARDDYKIEDMMLIIERKHLAQIVYIWMNFFTDAKDMNQVITLFWQLLN